MTVSTATRPKTFGLGGLRAAIYRLHSLGGILVAPFIIVATLSGLAYAISPSIEDWHYNHALRTDSEGPAKPVSEAIEAARNVHPDLQLASVVASEDPHDNLRVLFYDPAAPSETYRQAVFVDPITLEIRGDMRQFASFQSLPLRTFIDQGHSNLWLGEPGRFYSEIAASWLGALCFSGLFLLLHRWRYSTSKKNKPRRWHSAAGLIMLPGALALTITGLTWSKTAGKLISDIRTQMAWRPPHPTASEGTRSVAGDAGIDTALAVARDHGLHGVLNIVVPESGDAWGLSESPAQNWVFSYNAMSVDGVTGRVLETIPFSDWPIAARLTEWLIRAHIGSLFGVLNQALLAITALAILGSIVFGYTMWFRRGKGKSFGRLPAPKPWASIPRNWLIAYVVLMVCYSIIAPYFGLSVLAFWALSACLRGRHKQASGPLD